MPRPLRSIPGGLCVHALTRGNARATVFHNDEDYATFTRLITLANARIPIDLFAWCLMPNHVHIVARPHADGEMSRWMHWLLTTHVQQHRRRYRSTGHVWQGRYRTFPVQTDSYLLTVMRYVERNPVRAGLAASALDWKWSSCAERLRPHALQCPRLASSPVPLPQPWLEWVDTPLTSDELATVRQSVDRGRPLGDASWARGIGERVNLIATLRPRGRPRTL